MGGKEIFLKIICDTNVLRSCTKQGLATKWRGPKEKTLQCKVICANKTVLMPFYYFLSQLKYIISPVTFLKYTR